MRMDENGAFLFSEKEIQEADRRFREAHADVKAETDNPKAAAIAGLIAVMGYTAAISLDWAKQ